MSTRPTVFDALALRELARAATPGNKFHPDCPTRASGWQTRKCGEGWDVYGDDEDGLLSTIAFVSRRSDAEFIAAANPQTVCQYIEEISLVHAECNKLRLEVEKLTRERDEARASFASICRHSDEQRLELDRLRKSPLLSRLDEFAKAALTGTLAQDTDGRLNTKEAAEEAVRLAQATIRAIDGAGGA